MPCTLVTKARTCLYVNCKVGRVRYTGAILAGAWMSFLTPPIIIIKINYKTWALQYAHTAVLRVF